MKIGLIEDGADSDNFDSKNVVATDVISAMKKVKLLKNQYVSAVSLLYRVDKT